MIFIAIHLNVNGLIFFSQSLIKENNCAGKPMGSFKKQKNLSPYETGFPKYPSSKLDFEFKYRKNVV
jgi:NADH:ubiquinone oxidoreductase subunit 3 (subunit A)